MTQTQRSLSYQYDVFMKHQTDNNVMPECLQQYCVNGYNNMPKITQFSEVMNDIISTITKGDNPNNVSFRNAVKHCINTVHQGNYDEYLKKLKALNFASRENIHFLITELIICAMKCPISVKGFSFDEDQKYKSIPELCAELAKNFLSLNVQSEEKTFNFHEEMLKTCQKYFTDFVDLNKALDEHNENTSDNYKGFMTYMGLLYSKGIIGIKVVLGCMDTIKRSIFCSKCVSPKHQIITSEKHKCKESTDKLSGSNKTNNEMYKTICYFDCEKCGRASSDNNLITFRKHIECLNLLKGYEHLLTHVIYSFDNKVTEVFTTRDNIQKMLDKLTSFKDLIENKKLNDNLKSYISKLPLKLFTDTQNDEIVENFQNLVDMFNDESKMFESILKVINENILEETAKLTNITSTLDKMCEYIGLMITSHQEMITLNLYYKSLSKNQLTSPFRPYVVITHNTIGASMNRICEKLSKYKKIDAVFTSVASKN